MKYYVTAARLFTLVFCFSASMFAAAQSQIVTTSPPSVSVPAGQTGIEIAVNYDTDPTGNQTPGLGVKVVYDSSKLTLVSLEESYSTNFFGKTSLLPVSEIAEDTADIDSDSSTDKTAFISWVDLLPPGNWPAADDTDRPLELFRVKFDSSSTPITAAIETAVNVVIFESAAGYSATNATVAVELKPDAILPEITAPASITVEAAGATGTAASLDAIVTFLAGATATDNIDGDISTQVTTDAPGTFPLGNTTVTFTIEDSSSNSATDTAVVSVVDTTGPVVTAPSASTFAAANSSGSLSSQTDIASFLASATAIDLVNGEVAVTNNAPATLPLGETTIIFSASDSSGNSGSATSTLTLADQTAPSLSASNINIEATSASGAAFTASEISEATTVTDNVDGSNISVTASVSGVLAIGSTDVTYSASDAAGNTSTATATVTVRDTTEPEITVAERVVVTLDEPADVSVTNTLIADYLASATATDLVDGSVSVTNDAPDSYSSGTTTTITFTAVDATGNSSTTTGSVVVDVGPQITVGQSITVVSVDGNAVDATHPVISAFLAAATATDTEDGEVTVSNDAPSTFPLAITTVTFSATNSRSKTTNITATVTVISPTADSDTDADGIDDQYEVENGLDPNLDDSSEDADGDGRSNLDEYTEGKDPNADDVVPSVIAPDDVAVDATGRLTSVTLGTGSASDTLDGDLVPVADITGPFASGSHEVIWTATDAAGNSGTDTQIVKVRPLVEIPSRARGAEGATIGLGIELSGDAPDYPVTIPFTLSGSATETEDFVASSQSITIAEGRSATVNFELVADGIGGEGAETIELTLGAPQNAALGGIRSSTLTIVEEQVPPAIAFSVSQNGQVGQEVAVDGGQVTVVATITDPNGSHAYDWSQSDNNLIDLSTSPSRFEFDPTEMLPGVYKLVVDVTDDGITDRTFVASTLVSLVATAARADADGDGIPDELDVTEADNELSVDAASKQDTISAEAGVKLKVGGAALAEGVAGARVDESTIAESGEDGGDAPVNGNDESVAYPGGLFDFEIHDLPEPGQSVRLVLPLETGIPPGGTYRKYTEVNGWADFVVDDKNSIASTLAAGGTCPEPGSTAYVSGLTEGDDCIRLEIEDGGPNDADSSVNGIIDDPGGVAELDTDNDGVGNSADTDDDGDGVDDSSDAFPLDASETLDTDSDGTGNNADTDDDGDGVSDSSDAFPVDSSESVDTDGDGIGNNADTDDDGDGVSDSSDAFPVDSSESVDTDGDGIGNNADTDDDGDGVADTEDVFPLDETKSSNSSGGGCAAGTDGNDPTLGILVILALCWLARRRWVADR